MVSPQIKRREAWIKLPDEYEGFEIRAWINAPIRLWNAVESGDGSEMQTALTEIVLEHNGWLDFDGKLYPPANTESFWDEIPTELAACVLRVVQNEVSKLPNSLAPQSRRSRRG